MDVSLIVVLVVVTALVFDFTNGFHDTANAVATSVATGALSPRTAVALAGVMNLVGALLSTQVARTISDGLVHEERITPVVVFAGLFGAVLWNLVTWLFGLPSSSSHALFGGLIGATLVASGPGAINFSSIAGKVLLPAVISPVLAGAIALGVTYTVYRLAPTSAAGGGNRLKAGQAVAAGALALAHGTNDAQKTMGVITLTLITAHALAPGSGPPTWVVLSSGLAIAFGTYLGGWRIVQTLGRRVSDIQPTQSFVSQTTSTAVLLASTQLGLPLSTTQVCAGSILGAGAGRGLAAVRWHIAGRMVLAWLVTLPASAVVGALASWLAGSGTAGIGVVVVVGLAAGITIYAVSRLDPVRPDDVGSVDPDRMADQLAEDKTGDEISVVEDAVLAFPLDLRQVADEMASETSPNT